MNILILSISLIKKPPATQGSIYFNMGFDMYIVCLYYQSHCT